MPAGQCKHVSTDVAPIAAEYVPAVQLVEQVEAPVAAENFPAAHWEQAWKEVAPASGEYLPAVHGAQKSGDDAHLVPIYVPAGQSVQTEEPAVSAKVPASQGRQLAIDVAPGIGE